MRGFQSGSDSEEITAAHHFRSSDMYHNLIRLTLVLCTLLVLLSACGHIPQHG